MGKDNTAERYDRFSHTLTRQTLKGMEKWKNSDDVVEFDARLMELKSRREKRFIFSAFSQSKKKNIKLNPGKKSFVLHEDMRYEIFILLF